MQRLPWHEVRTTVHEALRRRLGRSPAVNTLPAHCVDAEYPDTIVYGLQSHPDKVREAGENCC